MSGLEEDNVGSIKKVKRSIKKPGLEIDLAYIRSSFQVFTCQYRTTKKDILLSNSLSG